MLAENLRDNARLDLCSLVVTALAELEPPHVRVLHTFVHEVPALHVITHQHEERRLALYSIERASAKPSS